MPTVNRFFATPSRRDLLYFPHMLAHTKRSIGTLLANAVKGYVKYLFAVPAILLHAFGLAMALVAVYAMLDSRDPLATRAAVGWMLDRFGADSISYEGNPTRHILRAYFFLALALEVLGGILKPVLPAWTFGFWKTFGLLILLSAALYALVVLAVAATGGTAVLPAFFLFGITTFFTFVAVGVAHVLDHLRVSTTPPRTNHL